MKTRIKNVAEEIENSRDVYFGWLEYFDKHEEFPTLEELTSWLKTSEYELRRLWPKMLKIDARGTVIKA